jgi:hypothetical protein
MKHIEKLIIEYITNFKEFLTKYCNTRIQKIYFYSGSEILPFTHNFLLIDDEIVAPIPKYFPNLNREVFSSEFSEYDYNIKTKIESKVTKLQSPPTHIKVTHDVATNTTTFEYIYDKLLDEDNGDTFGTYFDEWQYQLGKPRLVKNKIPKGHHIEFRTEPQYTYDDQRRVIKVVSKLVGLIVKDEDKNK